MNDGATPGEERGDFLLPFLKGYTLEKGHNVPILCSLSLKKKKKKAKAPGGTLDMYSMATTTESSWKVCSEPDEDDLEQSSCHFL